MPTPGRDAAVRRGVFNRLMGARVRAAREAAGYTEDRLELALGWFIGTVRQIETSGWLDVLEPYELSRAAEVLGVDTARLIPSFTDVDAAMADQQHGHAASRVRVLRTVARAPVGTGAPGSTSPAQVRR
jgi:transcriptional regulator with XRE-family HTH domain